jgi:3-oxoacyl-[acyl-carrier-protein] synthase-3
VSSYISAIAYDLGAAVPITASALGCSEELVEAFRADGQTTFRRASVTGSAMAAPPAQRSLAELRGVGGDVGDVVYCSESTAEGRSSEVTLAFREATGLDDTPTTLIGGFACANFVAGIRVGRALARCDDVPAVLVVTSDQFDEDESGDDVGRYGQVSRILGDGLAVVSDAAASCVLTTEPWGPAFRVVSLSLKTVASLAATSVTFTDLKASARVIASAVDDVLAEAKVTRADVGWVVVNNYRPGSRRFLTFSAGFRKPRGVPDSVAEIGHCFVSDPLISLASLQREGRLEDGDRVLVIATGGHAWSALLVEYVAGGGS